MQPQTTDWRIWRVIAGLLMLSVAGLLLSTRFVSYDYTLLIVAIGGAILGVVSGVLGSFAVLRQESLMGDALSHAALPGVAIGFLLFGKDAAGLLLGAGVAGCLGVLFIHSVTRTTRLKQDAAMGMTLAAFFAFGMVLLTYIQGRGDAAQAGLDEFIFGQAAAMTRGDVELISVVGSGAFLCLGAFWKEFKLITFNREFAEANGFPVRWLDALLSLLIVVAIVLGLQLAGVIMMVGMLIAPGIAARQWTQKLGQMVVLAGVFGGFAGATGAIISALDAGLPTGPLIIVVVSVLVGVSLLFAPERGIVWMQWQRRRDSRRFAAQHILRDMVSHARQHGNLKEPMREQTLINVRGDVARAGLKRLREQGWIKRTDTQPTQWRLTDSGIQKAESDARNRDLWRLYQQQGQALDLPIIPQERNQPIDTFLSDEAVQALERIRRDETHSYPESA